jgi:tetratricopeptide (TPR) repeat protein
MSGGLATLALAATIPTSTSSSGSKTGTRTSTTRTTVTSPKPGTGAKRPAATSGPARTTPTKRAAAKGPVRSPLEQGYIARQLEDAGAYGQAADQLEILRKMVKLDGDLELELALDEARSGQADSALARLSTRMMQAAANDSMPIQRRAEYPYRRETYWLNGKFDGWNWYILRARAELEAKRGHWKEAAAWARRATDAWVLNGKDWHILAVCAAQAGQEDEARQATAQAVLLDPTLPEARYLAGLWAWRDGKRAQALENFRHAVYLDSTYQAPAIAMIKARLPGSQPDPLPKELLTGVHQVALLTSPAGPKPEEFVQMDTPASLESAPDTAVVDSVPPGIKPTRLFVSILIDEHGLPVLNHVAWYQPSLFDFRKVLRILNSIPGMRFNPATLRSQPARVWVSIDYDLKP